MLPHEPSIGGSGGGVLGAVPEGFDPRAVFGDAVGKGERTEGRSPVSTSDGAPIKAAGPRLGHLDPSTIDTSMEKHIDGIRQCDEGAETAEGAYAGRLLIRFVIGTNGRVSEASVVSSTRRDERLEECVVARFRNIAFPEPERGGIVAVRVPVTFCPRND